MLMAELSIFFENLEIYWKLKTYSAAFFWPKRFWMLRGVYLSPVTFQFFICIWIISTKKLQLTPKFLNSVGHGYLLSWSPGQNTVCSESLFRSYNIPVEPKSDHKIFIPNSLYLLIVSHPTNQKQYSILNWEGCGKIRNRKWKKE